MKKNFKKENFSNSIIFGLPASKKMAESIAKNLKIELGKYEINEFADGEINLSIESSVRGKNVFVVQSTSKPVNDHLMQLLLFLDTLKRISAKFVTVIMPYYGYARQDRIAKGRQPISSKLVADLITSAGCGKIISYDIHSPQSQGFFNIPFDNLKAESDFVHHIKKNMKLKLDSATFTIVSPDSGGLGRARSFAKRFKLPIAVIDKKREISNHVESVENLLGDVNGKNVIILDDIVDTAGTMAASIEFLKKKGAKDIYIFFVHPVLSGTKENPNEAIQKLIKSGVKKIITTNTIEFIPHEENKDILEIVDLSQTLSDVIAINLTNESMTDYFEKKWK